MLLSRIAATRGGKKGKEHIAMAKKKRKGLLGRIMRGIGITLLSLVLVITLIADIALFGMFGIALDKVFLTVNADEADVARVTANGLEVARRMEEEGAVLLENDGALPLNASPEKPLKINLLGISACAPVYGGAGSGGSNYTANRVDFAAALTQAGFQVNSAVIDAYAGAAQESANSMRADYTNDEPAATAELASAMGQEFLYSGECSFEAMREYSDTAVVVIARRGGEGSDLPLTMEEYTSYGPDQGRHYLELNSAEESLLEQAKQNFERVIVLINAGNAMELGFLRGASQADPDAVGDIDAALWVGDPGDVGTIGVANLLAGTINPSGRTADIYPYAVETIPSYYNFDTFEYTNSSGCFEKFNSHPAYLLEYQEGIYVGYRYYETRKTYDYTTREGSQVNGAPYEDVVQYPFGYGLSYTSFDWDVAPAAQGTISEGETLRFDVTVTNTGSVAGKDVVELYYSAPYYSSVQGGSGIQKADVVLGAFAKTGLIQPGASETVTLELPVEQMASYDDLRYYSKAGSYVLEAGEYIISLRTDSHTVKGNAAYTYTVGQNVVFADEANASDAVNCRYVGKRSCDLITAQNLFDDVAGDVAYLSRDSWQIVGGSDREATAEQLDAFRTALELDGDYIDPADTAPAFGAKNGLSLSDLKGKTYDDPQWDALLDQLTIQDINKMLGANGWGSPAVSSVGKPQTYDMDGPSVLSYALNMFFGEAAYKTVAYPCEVIVASTWSEEMAELFGDAISQEGQVWNIAGWYAPGANTHRNPFSGRNYEYYSEDGLLGGRISAAVVKAAQENGMYCYVKHFALNERETQRYFGLCTYASEQAMREIYLVPFQLSVQEGNATGIMSSYNNLGSTWAGASRALLTDVLRNEWGFQGTVVTDNLQEQGFMSIEKAVAAGGTTLLYGFGQKNCDTLSQTASGQRLMREAAHQYLYTVANSYATEGITGMPVWRVPAMGISGALYAVTIGGIVGLIILGKKKKAKFAAENSGD